MPMRIALNGLVVAAVLGAGPLVPSDGEQVIVAAAPFAAPQTAGLIVAAAGGRVIDGFGSAVLAVSSEPGFVGRLYRAGALAVLSAESLGACTDHEVGGSGS